MCQTLNVFVWKSLYENYPNPQGALKELSVNRAHISQKYIKLLDNVKAEFMINLFLIHISHLFISLWCIIVLRGGMSLNYRISP